MVDKGLSISPSKRFRVRLRSTDQEVINGILSLTDLRTRSRSVRAALAFFYSLCVARAEGLKICIYHESSGELHNLEIDAENTVDFSHKKLRAESFLELRLNAADAEMLEAIRKLTNIRKLSEIVREALTLYFEAIQAKQLGFDVVAVSSSGQLLRIAFTIPWKKESKTETPESFSSKDSRKNKPDVKRKNRLFLPDELRLALEHIAGEKGISWQDGQAGEN